VHRFAYGGVLVAALALSACFSSGDGSGAPARTTDLSAAAAVARPPIDAANPAVTETATFGLG
jgi:hypothetical protein